MTRHSPLLPTAAAALLIALGAAGCSKPTELSAANPPAAPAAANVPDADVTEHVKAALRQTDSLKGMDIAIVTLKGDVRLTGVLDTQAQIDDAIRVARSTDGAHSIHDELTIKK